MTTADVIDALAGIVPESRLDGIRAGRPEAREDAQNSYLALFVPAAPGGLSLGERFAVGAFVAGLHGQAAARDFYAAELARHAGGETAAAVAAEVAAGSAAGPTAPIRPARSAGRTSRARFIASPPCAEH